MDTGALFATVMAAMVLLCSAYEFKARKERDARLLLGLGGSR